MFLVCEGVTILTCADNSKAVYVCCPVLAAAVAVMLWLLSLWMDSPDNAAPSTPSPINTNTSINSHGWECLWCTVCFTSLFCSNRRRIESMSQLPN